MRHALRATVVGVISLGILVGCGGEPEDSDEALRAQALTSTTSLSLDDFDLEHCKQTLLRRFWSQEKRDQVCEQIDDAIKKIQAFIEEYADDHLVGIGGVMLTDACVGGFAALYAEEDGAWALKEYAEYPLTGSCDGSASFGVGAAGIVEYAPPAVPGEIPAIKYGYAAMAAGPSGLLVRVRLGNGNRINLIVPW